jgi:hypothetical protein
MSNREHPDGLTLLKIHNVVREPDDGHSANREFPSHVRDQRTGLGPPNNVFERAGNCGQERRTQTSALIFVPDRSLFELGRCFAFETKREAHCSVRRRATRWRTISHGSPSD